MLTLLGGSFVFDPLIALLIVGAIIIPTVRTFSGSHRELLWPENVACGHTIS